MPVNQSVHRRWLISKGDLQVMGAYGHSRVRRRLLGSSTTTFIRAYLIPILLFR
jgi:nucleotide-binding universal stress UspA family protein